MTERGTWVWQRGQRGLDRIFDNVGARPLGLFVFSASVVLLIYLQTGLGGSIRAEAVASAPQIDHPARVSSFVTSVFVRPGDTVEIGSPLVELSSYFIDRELAQIDTQIEKLLHESNLAQARLMVEEQRWLSQDLRLSPERPSLEQPMEALYAQELALLHTQRSQLVQDRAGLTIEASEKGRVLYVALLGSSVAAGGSVASVSPEYAREIIAYVKADTEPASISPGSPVRITRPALTCGGQAAVLRRGGAVVEAPGQLRGFLRFPVYGMPVYISIPERCRLGVGQLLTVEFPRSVM